MAVEQESTTVPLLLQPGLPSHRQLAVSGWKQQLPLAPNSEPLHTPPPEMLRPSMQLQYGVPSLPLLQAKPMQAPPLLDPVEEQPCMAPRAAATSDAITM
jgi:hypothetical protein